MGTPPVNAIAQWCYNISYNDSSYKDNGLMTVVIKIIVINMKNDISFMDYNKGHRFPIHTQALLRVIVSFYN